MPRKPRFFLPGVLCHVVQRGRNQDPIFFESSDYHAYLEWLEEGLERFECELHAYVLMTNHVHLLITPNDKQGISLTMQHMGRHYVPYINYTYGMSGSLWEGRFKASLIDSEAYLLTCMRYIELNPVRANMVKAPGEYKWSSYKGNANAKEDLILTPHTEYLALGRSKAQREHAYRELFRHHIDVDDIHAIQDCWKSGTPLGNDRFREKIERTLKTKVGQASRGRPKSKID
jgi:putative transposase